CCNPQACREDSPSRGPKAAIPAQSEYRKFRLSMTAFGKNTLVLRSSIGDISQSRRAVCFGFGNTGISHLAKTVRQRNVNAEGPRVPKNSSYQSASMAEGLGEGRILALASSSKTSHTFLLVLITRGRTPGSVRHR